jgi:hypothetical protein
VEVERAALQRLFGSLREIEGAEAALRADVAAAERRLQEETAAGAFDSSLLAGIEGFRIWARRERLRLDAERQRTQQRIAAQRIRLSEARRDCELLERLKTKARAQWEYELNREMENLAADLYLARWDAKGAGTPRLRLPDPEPGAGPAGASATSGRRGIPPSRA